jgi:hypothetical protein
MRKMSAGILAAADKYLLKKLKMECETQFSHKTSAENCDIEFFTVVNRIQESCELKGWTEPLSTI